MQRYSGRVLSLNNPARFLRISARQTSAIRTPLTLLVMLLITLTMAGHLVLAQAATPNPVVSPKGSITPIIILPLPATPLPRLAVEPDAPGVSQAINQKLQGPKEPEPSSDVVQGSTPSQGAQQAQSPTASTAQAAQPEAARPADLPPGVIDWPARNFTSESGPGSFGPAPFIHEPGEGQAQSGISGEGPAPALPVATPVQGIVSEPNHLGEDSTPQNIPKTAPQTTPTASQSTTQRTPPPTKVWAVITNLFFRIFGFQP